MENFCGSKFWDSNITWYTSDPDLTPCFQATVLIWIPCTFLWIFSLMDILFSIKSPKFKKIPKSFLNVSKLILIICLITIEFIRIFKALNGEEDSHEVQYFSPGIQIATYILMFGLLHFSLNHGVQSSGIQFIFWFISLFCKILIFRSQIRRKSYENEKFEFILHSLDLAFVILQFILNSWADLKPLKIENKLTQSQCPEHNCSFLNRMLFCWFDSMIWKGYKNPLESKDIWHLNPEDTSNTIVPIFQRNLMKEIKNSKIESDRNKIENIKSPKIRILPIFFRSLGLTYIFGASLSFLPQMLLLSSPHILSLLIDFATGEGETWKGYLYAGILFSNAFISTLFLSQCSHHMYLTALRLRTGLVSLIYQKALKMSNTSKRETTVGEIVNLMSVDVQRLMETCHLIGVFWTLPIIVGVSIYFLWGILGPASLACLGILIALIPINGYIANKIKSLQTEQMKYKDDRVKQINEVLNGIKVLKLYAWEIPFEIQIQKIRNLEIKNLIKAGIWNGILSFCWQFVPFLISLSTFSIYILSDESHELDAQKVFMSLAYFNMMSAPFSFLPQILVSLIQGSVSLKRVNKFMNSEELNPNHVDHEENEDPILIEHGQFSWGKDQMPPTLENINMIIEKGKLIAIVGSVGSGKSSILSAILGELEKISGRVNTMGSIGYVAQQAWIMNISLKENILFGKELNRNKYDKVLNACALKQDLEILPDGDNTEIGEKGINLSGGQKQRVSLARAVYNDSDIYLLDDPLSAVDAHVGKHIFEHVIGPHGILQNKTRILVTHGIAFLPQMDQIIVMKDGKIFETGTFSELMAKNAEFSDFLNIHSGEIDKDKVPEKVDRKFSKEYEFQVPEEKFLRRTSNGSILELIEDSSEAKNKLIEIEKSETKNVKFSIYLDYFKSATMGYTLSTLILFFMYQGLSVGSNIWLSKWSNEADNLDSNDRNRYLGIYGGFGILQAICVLIGSLTLVFGTVKSSKVLHNRMLQRILQAPMSFFDSTPIGRIINRFSNDINISDNTLPFNVRWWLTSLLQLVAILVVISYSTPIFMTVIIPICLCCYFIQKYYVSTSRQLRRLESVSRSLIYSHFGESIIGASTIRAYKMQENFIKNSEMKVDDAQSSYFLTMVSNRWLQIRLETMGNLIVFFAALFVVIGRDNINEGLVGLSVTYALQVTTALIFIVRWTSDVETNIVSVERIVEYSGVVQEAPRNCDEHKPQESWPENGQIIFDKYQTRYREGLELVLKDITCEILPGEKIGVVGRTGAGKSSLTLALFRIIEASGGEILIDGKNISKLGLHDIRGRITIIPQDPVLFSGTLRINLDPFGLHPDDMIWKTLELAHLKNFAQNLELGLEHDIAEGGENLSVGQRQLVCLARSLLRKTKILVLDEATAAVDLDTDDLIQKTIRNEFKNSTVITIAHRLNTIMDSSRVMVLDNGVIKEFEAPEKLLENKESIFYSMAKDSGLA